MKKFTIELSANAADIMERMAAREPALYKRVERAIDDLEVDPFQGKTLKGYLKGRFSYRVGSYRIIYAINGHRLVVYVIDVGHRRDIYR